MKRVGRINLVFRLAVFFIYLLSVNFCAYAQSSDFIVETNYPPHIVFLGDSIAAGYGLDGYSSDNNTLCASYANILSAIFDSALDDEAGFSSENAAKNGMTSSDLLEKLSQGEYDEMLTDADAIVLSIGGNDLLRPFREILAEDLSLSERLDRFTSLSDELDKRLDEFEELLPQIVNSIFSCSDAKLFVQTLYNPFDGFSITSLDELADEKIGRLNEIIFECSDNNNFLVADIAQSFEGRAQELTNISDYDIHPNAQGHEEIARVLEPLIEGEVYTYYDAQAAMQYALEEENAAQLEKQNKKTAVIIAAISAFLIALICTIVFFIRRKLGAKRS